MLTVQSGPVNEGAKQGRTQAHQRPTPRDPARQESYKLTRRHAEFEGSDVIRFVVNGEEGIRLSDALEGNWEGFEGRDDRSLFDGDRLQIILRLQVREIRSASIIDGPPPRPIIPSSSSAVHPGNRR